MGAHASCSPSTSPGSERADSVADTVDLASSSSEDRALTARLGRTPLDAALGARLGKMPLQSALAALAAVSPLEALGTLGGTLGGTLSSAAVAAPLGPLETPNSLPPSGTALALATALATALVTALVAAPSGTAIALVTALSERSSEGLPSRRRQSTRSAARCSGGISYTAARSRERARLHSSVRTCEWKAVEGRGRSVVGRGRFDETAVEGR